MSSRKSSRSSRPSQPEWRRPLMLLADGTPIEVQVMIVLLNSLCASDVDRKSVALVRYFLSPAIHLGVVVNVCIAVGFAALHSGLVVAVYAYRVRQARTAHKTSGKKKVRVGSKKRYEISLEVSAALLYPGLPLTVCHVLYIGVACGTFDVLRTKDGSEAAISALGIVFLVAVPIIDAYLLRRVIKVAYVPYDLLGCVPKTGCLRWLYPVGVWGPTASVRRFFGLIGPYRDGYRYGALIPLLLALIIGLTMHGLNDIVPCDYLFVVNAFIIILVAALYVATRPTRATAQALLTALCLLCVGILAVLQIVAIRNNSTAIEAAKSALNYMVVFMVIVRSSHNIFVAYVEWKWAREVDAAAIGTTATISNTADEKPPQTSETHAGPAESSTSDAVRVPQVVVPITARPDSDEEDDAPATPVVMATFQTILDEYATDEIDGALARERHDDYMEVRPELADSATTVSDTSTEPARRVPSMAVANKQNNWEDLVPIGGPSTQAVHAEDYYETMSYGSVHTMMSSDDARVEPARGGEGRVSVCTLSSSRRISKGTLSLHTLPINGHVETILETSFSKYAHNASFSSASASASFTPRHQQQPLPGLFVGGGSTSRRMSLSAGAAYADVMSDGLVAHEHVRTPHPVVDQPSPTHMFSLSVDSTSATNTHSFGSLLTPKGRQSGCSRYRGSIGGGDSDHTTVTTTRRMSVTCNPVTYPIPEWTVPQGIMVGGGAISRGVRRRSTGIQPPTADTTHTVPASQLEAAPMISLENFDFNEDAKFPTPPGQMSEIQSWSWGDRGSVVPKSGSSSNLIPSPCNMPMPVNVFGNGNTFDDTSGSGSDAGGDAGMVGELFSDLSYDHNCATAAASAIDVPSSPTAHLDTASAAPNASAAVDGFQFHFT